MWNLLTDIFVVFISAASVGAPAAASQDARAPLAPAVSRPSAPSAELPPEYVIGPEDVLSVNFWRDQDMTRDEVVVRPDGRITLPLLGDVAAAGLTPEQLKAAIEEAASKLQTDPTVTVVVRQINSRKVYITGNVATPGTHQLTGPRTVMQLIALAGGLTEYADKKKIQIMRTERDGQVRSFKFNYSEVSKGKKLAQNVVLKPGDTIIVP